MIEADIIHLIHDIKVIPIDSTRRSHMREMNPAKAVYIHIPFCTNKCFYCDFNSYVVQGQPVDAYLDALEREMVLTVQQYPPQDIETIFVGGGTPTVLTVDQMERFLHMVRTHFPLHDPQHEFTMEANPGTTDVDKLAVMKYYGVNRLSFGVQSFNTTLLADIGRIHSTDDVYRSLDNARQVGFTNCSIDLMFGLPNQTLATLAHTLDAALALDLPHISIYGLKVEENTIFHNLYQKNELPLPTEDVEFEMYVMIMERLQQAGYVQYEISNFAKPGFEGKHNSKYWENAYYYGLGAGAHGYLQGQRHMNVKAVQAYIDAAQIGLPIQDQFVVSRQEAMEDFMMVGMRLMRGVRDIDFQAQFGVSLASEFAIPIQDLIRRGLIEPIADGYRLTHQGKLLGNEVFGAFLTSEA
jgi:putative oxygen-independent coproporphyrinogen III oxidase